MSSFPSSQERTVASSLLLLGTNPPSPSPSLSPSSFDSDPEDSIPERSTGKSCRESSLSSGSKSSSSSLNNDDGDSSEETKSRRIKYFSAIARYRQMKFKIVRKIRSKIMWTSSSSTSSGDRKLNTGVASKVSPGSVSAEASSCLSSGSSGISSARSLRYVQRARDARVLGMGREPHHGKHVVGSPHLRRRAEAILKLLSLGGTSEVRIRQLLGDSPDTSKALRMLLRVDAVRRSGSGGRHDPYVYTVS